MKLPDKAWKVMDLHNSCCMLFLSRNAKENGFFTSHFSLKIERHICLEKSWNACCKSHDMMEGTKCKNSLSLK